MTELLLTIPLEPPSGNHYKTYRIIESAKGSFVSWYLTNKANRWNECVFGAVVQKCQMNMRVDGKEHSVEYTVFQGSGSRGDVDNYAKTILDSLVKAGVLKSDASVIDMKASKRRDRLNPRTEIVVRAVTGGSK